MSSRRHRDGRREESCLVCWPRLPTSLVRAGFGTLVIVALSLVLLVVVGSVALSLQSSAARRFTSSTWMATVAYELGESAIAEAAHFLNVEDIFDPRLFGPEDGKRDLLSEVFVRMFKNDLPALREEFKSYRTIRRSDGAPARKMLVAIEFPRREVEVQVPGLAKKLALENRGVLLDRPEDLAVFVRPLTFRREYLRSVGRWVSWGVVCFRVRVRVAELRATVTHEIKVDRRFALRPRIPGQDIIKVSSINLRTTVQKIDA